MEGYRIRRELRDVWPQSPALLRGSQIVWEPKPWMYERLEQPNDPIFWLHHSNVDRPWANWQARRLGQAGGPPEKHYPPPNEPAPFGGQPKQGHRLNDVMWPWVGTATGYHTGVDDEPVGALLPDFSDRPEIRVNDVLDTETTDLDKDGYRYAPPASPGG